MNRRFDPEAASERLTRTFYEILAESASGGASLALWRGAERILSLHGGEASPGQPWNAETPCLIWSASKGVAAACTLHALQEQKIPLRTRVSALWPAFAAAGKESITLAGLLSHRAGLAALDTMGLSLTDHDGVATALAAQAPNWELEDSVSDSRQASHGYGARTFGYLLDEIVRRTVGESLAAYWERLFRIPLGLDLWFGLPQDRMGLAADVIAPKTPPEPGPFSRAFGDPSSLTRRALSEPGKALTPTIINTPEMRGASLPSLGAISTADSLARFYALLADPACRLFTEETRTLMRSTLSSGPDRVLIDATSFSAGFMTNEHGVYGPSPSAFGHPGAGGAIGFADPELGLGFAFIPSAMHPGALPGRRTRRLVRALYGTEGSE